MRYVDVILPVPLDGTFTYSLSDSQAAFFPQPSGQAGLGMRVLVPFGTNKTYAGLVARVHDDKPALAADKVKQVLAVLDAVPVLMPLQLRLWRWIASYYMSSIGDVMNAALPAGLKADTGYRPKTVAMVALGDKFANSQGVAIALEMLRRSPKQLEVLKTFLQRQDHASPPAEGASFALTREELLNEAHCTAATLKRLVEQGFMRTYEQEEGTIQNSRSPVQISRAKMQSSQFPVQSLTADQAEAKRQIEEQWGQKNVVLLHGVTSSGKTEIYIHLIAEAIGRGQQVLYLLPEIALTVQMTQRLQKVFGRRLGIYHSKYSDAERTRIWMKQLSAEPYDVILGARSAVFLPFQRLGLVIVDEEHVQSFKQQDPAPRYHARSVAIVLAQMCGAKTLLGSATPSVESWHNAVTGKYGLVTLSRRYQGIQLPEIEIVDTKDLRRRKMMGGPLSPRLLSAMREALAGGRQVILFQNRRGFAPVLSCGVCGWTPKCKNCDVSLTYHKRLGLLTCHYCGHTEKVPDVCPNCGNTHLSDRGFGTEKIEDLVRATFPEASVARMDLDTTHTRNAYERIITEFGAGRTNILIGTQMISKGLDFANVAVVGILDADSMLNFPDFRAYEQAFQMMSQVAGRAGRKGRRGLVILQTKDPRLPVIQQVARNDFQGFFHDILEERAAFLYPPFCHLVYVYLRHKDEPIVEAAAQEMAALLKRASLSPSPSPAGERLVLGPDKPAVARVKNLFIRKIVVKTGLGADRNAVRQTLCGVRSAILAQACYRSVKIYFDVDPL